jgi:hypothetical protein
VQLLLLGLDFKVKVLLVCVLAGADVRRNVVSQPVVDASLTALAAERHNGSLGSA